MPVLDSYKVSPKALTPSALPFQQKPLEEKGIEIYREIVPLGTAVDGRSIKPDEIQQVYKNTISEMFEKGAVVRVNLNHGQNPGELEGFVTQLDRVQNVDGSESLFAKMFLYEETAGKYSKGRYPDVSPSLRDDGYARDGGHFGWYLDSVSLQGNRSPAFPVMNVPGMFEKMTTMVTDIVSKVLGGRKFNKDTKDYEVKQMPMDKDKLISIADGLKAIIVMVEDAIASYGDEGEMAKDKKEETKEGEMAKASAEFSKQLAAAKAEFEAEKSKLKADLAKVQTDSKTTEINLAFEALKTAGFITDGDKPDFAEVAGLKGLDFAKKIYNVKRGEAPPITDPLPSTAAVGGEKLPDGVKMFTKGLGADAEFQKKVEARLASNGTY